MVGHKSNVALGLGLSPARLVDCNLQSILGLDGFRCIVDSPHRVMLNFEAWPVHQSLKTMDDSRIKSPSSYHTLKLTKRGSSGIFPTKNTHRIRDMSLYRLPKISLLFFACGREAIPAHLAADEGLFHDTKG